MRKYILVRHDGVALSESNSARKLELLRAELASQNTASQVYSADDLPDDPPSRSDREAWAIDHARDYRKHER